MDVPTKIAAMSARSAGADARMQDAANQCQRLVEGIPSLLAGATVEPAAVVEAERLLATARRGLVLAQKAFRRAQVAVIKGA